MRLFHASIIGILIASPMVYAHQQDAPSQSAPVKEAQTSETKGLPPRSAPTDYQAHAQAGNVTIAADFVGHSVPTAESTYSTEDYVVIETAFFGPADGRLKLSVDDFTLRVNTKKKPLPG